MAQLQADLALPRLPMGYLSAPMSAPDALTRCLHQLAAKRVSHELWEAEVLHYCPHTNSPTIGSSDVAYEMWMAMDLEVVRRCDFIVMAGNWNESPGCRRELAMAMHLNIPVAYSVEAAIDLYQQLRSKVA